MAENKESTSSSLSQGLTHHDSDPDDIPKSPPSSPNSSTRKACYAVLQSWVSKKFMTGCLLMVSLAQYMLNLALTFSALDLLLHYFLYSSLEFLHHHGWVQLFSGLENGFIKRMPFMKHIYSASKQISAAISPDQNTTAFKEVAIIRHPRHGEYAFGFITSSVILQREDGDEELCSVYVPTNHLYIGDIFLVNSDEIIRPNLSIREGIEIIVSVGMTMPQLISSVERIPHQSNRIPLSRIALKLFNS
ncbi:hypothetical protein GH714_025112 [Hevea brasiliensis]|uniref:Uncharacterized protein n=1 Tax=Hevea brasiliensis TaxID=3981 RepID=A0A6A6LAF0_HEVBR|nr:hypothetical protein GH714_025112 [Hevea brasiliensis]